MRIFRLLVLGLIFVAELSMAQSYPDKSRPLRIIVAQGPGSTSDLLARSLAKAVTDETGWPAIVDFKPGAEGIVGVQALMNSPADGYSMLLVSSSTTVLNPVLVPNLPYAPLRDFIPLVGVAKTVLAFNVGPSTPFKSAREFLAAAKANPGKYTFGSSTTTTRLAGELLEARAGVKLLNVPYKTTSAAVTALIGGEVDLVLADASSLRAQWESGRARPLAVTTGVRSNGLAALPTLREEGVPDYELTSWYATYFGARTPPEVVASMRQILRKVAKAPGLQEVLAKGSMDPFDLAGDEISAVIRREIDSAGKLVRATNLSAPK